MDGHRDHGHTEGLQKHWPRIPYLAVQKGEGDAVEAHVLVVKPNYYVAFNQGPIP